jgi:hypothetical protein
VDARRFAEVGQVPFFDGEVLRLVDGLEGHRLHLELYAHVIEAYLPGATALVELGAGYGSILFGLAERLPLGERRLFGLEYTRTGAELIGRLGTNSAIEVKSGRCDFARLTMDEVGIEPGAVLFTSYAAAYVPELSDDFVDYLDALDPLIVLHFEPSYEHYPSDSLHGLLCRRYVEVNDYNTNLVSMLHRQVDRGRIEIVLERKNVLGSNPLLPISVIGWRARR